MAGAVAAVPCTGAPLVILFGLANDLVVPAVIMVFAISVGMPVAMPAIEGSALSARNWAGTRCSPDPGRRHRFETGTQLAGAACVLAGGSALFVPR